MKLIDAFSFVKYKRSIIWPNEGFMKYLISLEKSIYKSNTLT